MKHQKWYSLSAEQVLRLKRYFVPLLIIGTLIAMGISLAIGLAQSVWFDEAYSIMLAKQPVGQLIHLTSLDTHPPFYYLLLKAWAGLFGWSELALRSLSILSMGGAAVIAGVLLRRLFGTRAALISLPFVLFAPFLIRYGFEIRMYAFASLIGISATYVLVRALQSTATRAKWWLFGSYAVLVALGVYTLYYLALLWIAHLVWLIWLTWREEKSLLRAPWLVAYIGSAVLFLPWLPAFLRQLGNNALAPISQALTLDNLLGVVSFSFLYRPTWQVDAVLSLVIVFVLIALTFFIMKALKQASDRERSYLVLLALYVIVPLAVLALVSLLRPMYVERYISHVIIGGYALVGVSIAVVTSKRPSGKVVASAAVLLLVLLTGTVRVAQVGNYNFQRAQTPTVKQIATALPACTADTALLAGDPYAAIELAYYVPDCPIHFYSASDILGGGYAPLSGSSLQVRDPARDLADAQHVIYVYYDSPSLKLPPHLKETAAHTYGALSAARFDAK